MRTVFLEYAWDMNWCDPCAADPLTDDELRQLGVFWTADRDRNPGIRGQGVTSDVFVTRLHVRYDAAHFPEDLVFQQTNDRENFQGRYVIRHPWVGKDRCEAAREVPARSGAAARGGNSSPRVAHRMASGGHPPPNGFAQGGAGTWRLAVRALAVNYGIDTWPDVPGTDDGGVGEMSDECFLPVTNRHGPRLARSGDGAGPSCDGTVCTRDQTKSRVRASKPPGIPAPGRGCSPIVMTAILYAPVRRPPGAPRLTLAWTRCVLDRSASTLRMACCFETKSRCPSRRVRWVCSSTFWNAPGRLVTKQALMDAVWKDATVTETSLIEAVSVVRQALGDDPQQPAYIQTVHRRGYRFVAPLIAVHEHALRASDPRGCRTRRGSSRRGHRSARTISPAPRPAWIAAATGAAALVTWMGMEPRWEAPVRPVMRAVIQLSPDEAVHAAAQPDVALSGDGRRLVYSSGTPDNRRLYIRDMGRFESQPIAGSAGGFAPFFSPDGHWVGFFAEGKLKKVSLEAGGGDPLVLCEAPTRTAPPGTATRRSFSRLHRREVWPVCRRAAATRNRSRLPNRRNPQ